MFDDELSTKRQRSDASSEEAEEEFVECRFTNALNGDTLFKSKVKFGDQVSVGVVVNLVSSRLGNSRDFHITVGNQTWDVDDVYGKFWRCKSVQDALGNAKDNVLVVKVVRVTS